MQNVCHVIFKLLISFYYCNNRNHRIIELSFIDKCTLEINIGNKYFFIPVPDIFMLCGSTANALWQIYRVKGFLEMVKKHSEQDTKGTQSQEE